MRAVIYRRQSLDKAGDELGIDRQERECRRLCELRGYDVVEVVTDNSVTASKHGRPGYAYLLDLISRRAVDVVVILRIDRLLRLNDELEQLVALSEGTGVKVATVEGDIDLSTPSGRLVARVLVSVARAEMETKSARHQLANEQKARAGKPHGSRRPYGYEADLVTIRESEAAVLRAMAERFIGGHSYKEIAWWANGQGHMTTQGKLFYPVTVRNMLRKKRYAGIRDYKGGEYPGNWQPVLDSETWDRLQLTMKLRLEKNGSIPKGRKYLLTGLVYCGICGTPMNGAAKRDRPGTPMRRTYNCRSQGDATKRKGCGGVRRNADALDAWITELVLYRLDTPELGDLLAGDQSDTALRHLLGDRKAQQDRLDALVDDYATGILSKAQLVRAKTAGESALKLIEEDIDRLNRERTAGGLVPLGQSIRQAWETSDSDEWRRALLGLLIKRITVNPGIIKPFYTLPDGRVCRFAPELIDVLWLH